MNLLALPVPGRVAERRLDFTVEAADATHLPEMAAIYREQIAAGFGSFEDPLPDAAELGRRLAAVREAGLPAYVALDGDGRVLGFCWARPFRAIAAYSKTVEELDPCRQRRAPARGRARAARGADRRLQEAGLPRR